MILHGSVHRRSNFGALWLLLVLAISGCGETPASKPGSAKAEPAPKTGDKTAASSSSSAAAPKSSATIALVDPAGLEKEVASHSGKVVLVDFWSTTCIPCIHGLPKMAELKRKFADKGLVVISVAMDDKQDDEKDDQFHVRLLSALGNSQSEFTNLLSKPGGSEEAMLAFGIEGGALPHYRLFGRDGKLIRKFVSGDSDAIWDSTDVVKAAEEAVAKK